MAYRIEGEDIVISGWENGIADSPYNGIADMRNVNIDAMPKEAMVNFALQAAAKPPVLNATAYTAVATTDIFTWAGSSLYSGCALKVASSQGGLTANIVYYVKVLSPTTFSLYLDPAFQTLVNVTGDHSGTFTTYQYGDQRGNGVGYSPISYWVDQTGAASGNNATYLVDASNYVWMLTPPVSSPYAGSSLIFLGNIGGIGATTNYGAVAIWKGYIFLFASGSANIAVALMSNLLVTNGPAATWNYAWGALATSSNGPPKLLHSSEDDNLYFTSTEGLGSISEVPGQTFLPTNAATYTRTATAVTLPSNDFSTVFCELGSNLYIGGTRSFVYVWDKISPGFNNIITFSESLVQQIVATDTNVFVFIGNKGSIYYTNYSSIDLVKKVPNYLTGLAMPYILFTDASYVRGNIYFAFAAYTSNSGTFTQQTTTGGVWALDVEKFTLRMINKTTYADYSPYISMVTEGPRRSQNSFFTQPIGTGLTVGWTVGSTYTVDIPLGTPYANYEAYIETDIIPVGTMLNPFTPSQIEWKTSVPLGGNGTSESVRISYRTNLLEAYTVIGTSTSTSTTLNGHSSISEMMQANFQKAQWVQFKIELSSNATTPTYVRFYELRVRDFVAK